VGAGIFASDSMIRVVGSEGILLASGGAAVIMQTSHPQIAQGVHDHSDFARAPFSRLLTTMEWAFAVTFGTDAEAERVSAIVRALHKRVTGSGYRADDPRLQVWVNATLLANSVVIYQRVFGRLTPDQLEAYYQQQKTVAEMIGCPRDSHPATYPEFLDYYRNMVNTLEISDESRDIAQHVLHPELPILLRPALIPLRLLTVGLLPAPLRRQYRWRWTWLHEAAFLLLVRVIAVIYPRLPRWIRTLPRDVSLYSVRRRFSVAATRGH
jgi:uncharacterized protein (DUF2236 family)